MVDSLFTADGFTLDFEEEPAGEVSAVQDIELEDLFAEAEAVEAPDEPEPAAVDNRPRWSETAWVRSQTGAPATAVLQRVGNRKVSLTAADLISAQMIMTFQEGGVDALRPDLNSTARSNSCEPVTVAGQDDEDYRDTAFRVKIYFAANDIVAPEVRNSKLYRFLSDLGFNLVVSPSLANWAPREYARRERDNTSFLLPEVRDTRPIYDRMEEGTLVRCIQEIGRFTPGQQYMVGDKVVANEESGEEGHINLHQYVGRPYSFALPWNAIDEMEPYFEVVQDDVVIYEPSRCVPEVYKQQFEANLARIDKAGWELFEHTRYDAAQAAVKSVYFNGKPMRMGKSREAIAFLKLRNQKRTAFIGPKNVLPFIARELDTLGIKDYRILDSYETLQNGEKQPWMELIPYGWMKYRRDPLSAKNSTTMADRVNCPHCGDQLERREAVEELQPDGSRRTVYQWTPFYGYLCRNVSCRVNRRPSVTTGAVWSRGEQPKRKKRWRGETLVEPVALKAQGGRTGSGYVDYARKAHLKHARFDNNGAMVDNFRGSRQCQVCGFIEKEWTPAPYRRLKHRYTGAALDELHGIKTGSSDITLAVLSLKLRTIAGLTGTLMPNDPSDAYWPLFRMFGNNTHRFPYAKTKRQPYAGVTGFNNDFTSSVIIENRDTDSEYKKRIPYLKNPVRFWQLMAPKMIRRSYEDPLVVESLRKAGLVLPDCERRVIMVTPDPKQAAQMLGSMEEFRGEFQRYREELRQRGTQDRTALINTSYVISQMTRMRMAATVPDYINIRLAKANLPPLYTGPRGGAKMQQVYDLCLSKCSKGEKVLILSDFRDMQAIVAEELSVFRPILFNTSWDGTKRQEAFDQFNQDPESQIFIAGPRAIGLGVDLAGGPDSLCRTVISTDLLWRPGEQQQAWARIQKPAKEKYTVEVYILVLDASIDRHVYSTFYSKLFAAEQALDRKVITQKEKAFDVTTFVDQVMADRSRMIEYMERAAGEELSYLPYVELFNREDRVV